VNPPGVFVADVGELLTTDGVVLFVFIGSQFNTERFGALGDCLLI
jgi:hypothetical protein